MAAAGMRLSAGTAGGQVLPSLPPPPPPHLRVPAALQRGPPCRLPVAAASSTSGGASPAPPSRKAAGEPSAQDEQDLPPQPSAARRGQPARRSGPQQAAAQLPSVLQRPDYPQQQQQQPQQARQVNGATASSLDTPAGRAVQAEGRAAAGQHAAGRATRAELQSAAEGPADGQSAQGRARELNQAICAASTEGSLLQLIGDQLPAFSLVNAITAFHRLGKHSMRLPAAQRAVVRQHPHCAALAARLEGEVGRLDCLQLAQLLWAHAQLGHGSGTLVDGLYSRLATAVVVGPGGKTGGADSGSGNTTSSRVSGSRVSGSSPSAAGSGEEEGQRGPLQGQAGEQPEWRQHGEVAEEGEDSGQRGQPEMKRRRGAKKGRQRGVGAAGNPGPPLRLDSMNAAVMLAYAQAKLGRPVPTLLDQLARVLLAEPPRDPEGRQSRPAQSSGLRGTQRVAAEAAAHGEQAAAGPSKDSDSKARRAAGTGGNSDGGGGGRAGEDGGAGFAAVPIGLAGISHRNLSLLMWSMATLHALPPALLRRCLAVLRRGGLGGLSVQSITHAILAQQLTAAPEAAPPGGAAGGVPFEVTGAAEAAKVVLGLGPEGGAFSAGTAGQASFVDSRHAAPAGATAAGAGAAAAPGAAAVCGSSGSSSSPAFMGSTSCCCWDQGFMDEVAAELASRHRYKQPRFWLNEADISILARGFSLAWQAAVVAAPGPGKSSGVGVEGSAAAAPGNIAPENRLALRMSLQRHISRFKPRKKLLDLLVIAAMQRAPKLTTRGVSSLVCSFASLLGTHPPAPLLEALAERAMELEDERCLDAQAIASLAWAYSTLQYDNPLLYERLAHAVLRMLHRPSGKGPRADAQRSISAAASKSSREAFSAQTVSLLVFSFASANRCSSPAQQQMMAALAERADEVLPDLTAQGLANVAWGLAVAGCYPPQLFRRWRALAGASHRLFKPAELNQLHLVEVALRLEAPPGIGIGQPLPAEAASFFESLYQAGRLRAFAGSAWARHQEWGPRIVSDFQLQVHRTICELGVACQLEHSEAGEYSIDVALPLHRIAVEADGPVHFACNSTHLMGGTALKRRLLQQLGWRVVSVPYHQWRELLPDQRLLYMKRQLEAAGLQLPVQQQEPGSPMQAAEAGAEGWRGKGREGGGGAQQPAQEGKQTVPAAQQRVQQEAQQQQQVQQAVPGRQPQQEEHGRSVPRLGEDSPIAGGEDEAKAVPPSSPADQAAAAATPEPAPGLAQRAQRLSMLQYRQGKLSARGLVACNSTLRAASGSVDRASSTSAGSIPSSGSDDGASCSGSSGEAGGLPGSSSSSSSDTSSPAVN